MNSLKGRPCPGDQHSNYRNPFQNDTESRSAEQARDLRWEQHDREYYGTSEQGTKYDHATPKSRDSGIKSRTNSKDSAQRDHEEWVGDGDRAEWEAQERIA